jgi:hypothetical protein
MKGQWRLGVAVVVLSIVVLLVVLFPSMVARLPRKTAMLAARREQARAASSLSNVKQLAPAMQVFQGKVGEYNALAEQAMQQQADTMYAMNIAGTPGAPPTAGHITVPGGYPLQAPRRTDATIDLQVHYKKQEGVYLTTYDAAFSGDYEFRNPNHDYPSRIVLTFPFPPNVNTLSNLKMLVNGKEATETRTSMKGITWAGWFKPDESKTIHVEYEAQGIDDYSYATDHDRLNPFFRVVANVTGVEELELPNECLRLREREAIDGGFRLTWFHQGLVTSRDIMLDLPDKEPELTLAARLQEYAGRFSLLCRLAPLFVLLFVAGVALSARVGAPALDTESLVLLALNSLLLYPLLIFAAGFLGVGQAFWLAVSAISLLNVLYVWRRGGVGLLWRVLLLSAILLGVFSYGVLQPRLTGLLLSGGGIAVIAFFMLSHALWPPPAPEPAWPESPPPPQPPVESLSPAAARGFCAYCGARLGEGYHYCPNCARAVHQTKRCANCGLEVCAECGKEFRHCPACGAQV